MISVGKMPKTFLELKAILERQINVVKYSIHCVSVIEFILGGFLFGLAVAVRLDTGLQEWIDTLDIGEYYIGIYVLTFASVVVLLLAALSCVAVHQEITQLLLVNAAAHVACYFLLMLGSGITLHNNAVDGDLQYSIRNSMNNLIAHSFEGRNAEQLHLIQEEIGCCGANGPKDYLLLQKPLPNECRDSVTGNGYFYGCGDEILWLLEDKSSWLTGLAFTLSFLQMLIATLSYILIEALRKEETMS